MARDLGLVVSACGGMPERLVTDVAEPATRRGWRLAITLTPTAWSWLDHTGDLDGLRALTDLEVRQASRLPDEPRPHPDPDVFLFAPATASSVAKLALGIADNQALTVLGDVLGVPGNTMIVGYRVRDTRAYHPAWQAHLERLSSVGVHLHRLDAGRSWVTVVDLLPDSGM